jgi:hypothetical protein
MNHIILHYITHEHDLGIKLVLFIPTQHCYYLIKNMYKLEIIKTKVTLDADAMSKIVGIHFQQIKSLSCILFHNKKKRFLR